MVETAMVISRRRNPKSQIPTLIYIIVVKRQITTVISRLTILDSHDPEKPG